MEEEQPQQQAPSDVVLDLNFVPKWAREPAGKNPYAHFEGRDRRDRPDRRGNFRDRRGPPRGREKGPRGPRRETDRDRRRPDERPDFRREREPRRFEHETPSGPPPIDISFIPERNRLGRVAGDLRKSNRAYPLAGIAARFLSNPACYLVKIEPQRGGEKAASVRLCQCKECGIAFLDETGLISHSVRRHLDVPFIREDVERDPPAGNYVCVARCRLSRELLGPPNYHGYNERVLELHKRRFSHMSLDDYRGQIETVHDPALVEQWKDQFRKQTVYRIRDKEDAATMTRGEAEELFRKEHAASFILRPKRLIVGSEVVARFEDQTLKRALHQAWTRESHRPFTLMLALRPAFHHMRLYIFKTRNAGTFVCAIRPHPLRSDQVVESIAEVLSFLTEHPGCTRQELVEGLRSGAAPDSAEVQQVIGSLRWLIERGHVIEFFNGTLSVLTPPARKPRGKSNTAR